MKKYIYDEHNKLWYELHGEQYFPCLSLPDTTIQPIGIWGRRRLHFIKEHRKVLYTELLFSDELHRHLTDIDSAATEMFNILIKQLAAKEGCSEQLKAVDPVAWTALMNNIRSTAREIVYHELIHL